MSDTKKKPGGGKAGGKSAGKSPGKPGGKAGGKPGGKSAAGGGPRGGPPQKVVRDAAVDTGVVAQASPAETAAHAAALPRRGARQAGAPSSATRTRCRCRKLEKIVINMGVGEATGDQKKLDAAVAELTLIAGQKPVKTVAKKAIAGFKIRKGLPIGCKVTLRKARMYEFLDRLVTIALPRVRDFRGITGKGFDGRGNFAMGLKEQIVFPEINYDRVDQVRGMDIQFVTTAKTDAEAKALLKAFDLPFAN